MYGCESWTVKNAECPRIDAFELWCWRRLLRFPWVARRSTQSILKEISPGFSLEGMMLKLKVLWPPHAKIWLIGKDSDAGMGWGQEEKGTTEDEMAKYHHWLDGCGSGWTLGVGYGQGGLACCDSWGHEGSDTTEWLNWTELNILLLKYKACVFPQPHWRGLLSVSSLVPVKIPYKIPYLSLESLLAPQSFPACPNLLDTGLCGSFLGTTTMLSALQRLMWASLSLLNFSCILLHLYELASDHWAHPLLHRACVHLFGLPRPTFYVVGLVCTCFSSLACLLCHGACVLFFWLPGPTSVPQGLCVLQKFVCHSSLSTLGLPSVLWGYCGLPFGSLSMLPGWGHICVLFMGWEVQFSLFYPL